VSDDRTVGSPFRAFNDGRDLLAKKIKAIGEPILVEHVDALYEDSAGAVLAPEFVQRHRKHSRTCDDPAVRKGIPDVDDLRIYSILLLRGF
jgi:hypothetical protein